MDGLLFVILFHFLEIMICKKDVSTLGQGLSTCGTWDDIAINSRYCFFVI